MKTFHIFIVEDDPWYGEILEYTLSLNPDNQITRFSAAKECIDNLYKKPDLVTIDYSLPDTDGATLLKRIHKENPLLPVIVISSQNDINTAVNLLKHGASDYIVKDDNTRTLLWNAVTRIREKQSLQEEVETLREELGHKYDFEKIVKGNSPALKGIFKLMEKAARTNINVSITGETGTGKELVAKAVHYNSERKNKPFVAVNMAAIPSELLESELFGYEKGAFTGALTRKIGKFEEADKGTLFLDEIGELQPALQSKLLRVLQERELVRIGGREKVSLDVRLIVATHRNLADQVAKGEFREDLYYRIMGLTIALPPLRQRDGDVIILAKMFLDEFNKQNKLAPKQLSTGAKSKLLKYHFPGNIRELKAIIDLAAVMCEGKEISGDDIIFNAANNQNLPIGYEKSLKDYTNKVIAHFLKEYNDNVLKVAERLDIGKSTIYRYLKEVEEKPAK